MLARTWCLHCWGPGSIPGRELRSHKLRGAAKKQSKRKNKQKHWIKPQVQELGTNRTMLGPAWESGFRVKCLHCSWYTRGRLQYKGYKLDKPFGTGRWKVTGYPEEALLPEKIKSLWNNTSTSLFISHVVSLDRNQQKHLWGPLFGGVV